MSMSIKVTERTKKKLDLLQAKIIISTGKKMPLQDIVDKISDLALRQEGAIARELPPVEKDPAWRKAKNWGIKTDASRIDEYLYA